MVDRCKEGIGCRLHYRDYHVGWSGWKPQGKKLAAQWIAVRFDKNEDYFICTNVQYVPPPVASTAATHQRSLGAATSDVIEALAITLKSIDDKCAEMQ